MKRRSQVNYTPQKKKKNSVADLIESEENECPAPDP
jgi:hypothetical protein